MFSVKFNDLFCKLVLILIIYLQLRCEMKIKFFAYNLVDLIKYLFTLKVMLTFYLIISVVLLLFKSIKTQIFFQNEL